MNKFFLGLIFILGACSKSSSEFVSLHTINCHKLSELYTTDDLANLPDLARQADSLECGRRSASPDFFIRKSIIRTKYVRYGIRLNMDGGGNLQVSEVNVPHCIIQSLKGSVVVEESCEDIK